MDTKVPTGNTVKTEVTTTLILYSFKTEVISVEEKTRKVGQNPWRKMGR